MGTSNTSSQALPNQGVRLNGISDQDKSDQLRRSAPGVHRLLSRRQTW